eukprot:SAG31_NODE_274_length_18666_cov_72.753972_9_plen_246_part_00
MFGGWVQVAETRAFASLDEIRDMYFTWREWVFGGGVVNSTQAASEPFDRITGCLEWFGRRTSDLPFAGLQLPFKLALMLDRKMNVQRFDPVCAIPPNGALFRLSGELLPGGKAKIVGDDQYEIDVTTESRQKGTQTRYRLFIDGGDFTGKIETKIIGGRVKHRGRVDGCLTSSGQKVRSVSRCRRVPIMASLDEYMTALVQLVAHSALVSSYDVCVHWMNLHHCNLFHFAACLRRALNGPNRLAG